MREIIIDTDTKVVYDYEKKIYIIYNKDTATTRTEAKEVMRVLAVLFGTAPIEDEDHNPITKDRLEAFAKETLYLESLAYTWEDTGAYIKTVQFNDYSKYPLTLDAEKKKLYIMNTPVIFDLILNVNMRERLEQIQAFYKDTLGLYLELTDLREVYCTLTNYMHNPDTHTYTYTPTCYNVIQQPTEDQESTYSLVYSNILKLHDYLDKSPAHYSCTLNPTDQYTPQEIAKITRIEGNVITLNTTVPSIIHVGSKIQLTNTVTTVDMSTYSSDGTYTVKDIQDNLIYTTENLPADFLVLLPTLNIKAYPSTVQSMNRENQTITLTNSATNFVVGDTVIVEHADVVTEYDTLHNDGFYTIIKIEGNILYTQEAITTDYSGGTATLYKPIPVAEIEEINTGGNIVVAPTQYYSKLQVNSPVVEITPDQDVYKIQHATVTGIYTGGNIQLDTAWNNNVQQAGVLNERIPYPNTLVTVSDSNAELVLPNGSFMLDDTEQAVAYLGLLEGLQLPDTENENHLGFFDNCYKEVKDYYIIHVSTGNNMKLLGLYSKIYKDKEV